MTIKNRSKPYIIPEYSLTGDLLSYLACGLQYRYQNKGSLPPSTPVQLWFGEFIHGVMEEAYLVWKHSDKPEFPWAWDSSSDITIRKIELDIYKRLSASGLHPPPKLFCPYDSSMEQQGLCPDKHHPHKLIGSKRVELAINIWGSHLFPLIDQSEVKLKGIRDMPNYNPKKSRSNYYGITGVIDVLSSVTIKNAGQNNKIINKLEQNPELKGKIKKLSSSEYEIIIDYKGMRRPSLPLKNENIWQYHEWQILTYSWLRSMQPDSKPIIAGIIFYLNELALSGEDMQALKSDIKNNSTDILPQKDDLSKILAWKRGDPVPTLSNDFLENRSIRIIPIDNKLIDGSLKEFDGVIDKIENSVLSEICGNTIKASWNTNPVERTCTACDFKTYCPNPAPRKYYPTVP